MSNNVEGKKLKTKDWALIALIACITSLSIAYATISATLTITNSLTVKATNWDIHFENLQQEEITGSNDAKILTPATIQEDTTQISGLQVELKKPGDYVSYTFDIKNAGEIDALLTSLNIGTPVCTPNHIVCNDIEYTLKYADGSNIEATDALNAGEKVKVKLTIGIKLSSTQTVDEEVKVNGLDAVFLYTQK